MTETRHRFVGDKIVYEFAVQLNGVDTPIPSATLECALIAPDKTIIAGAAAWLSAPDDHVVRCEIADGLTTQEGRHDLQLKITDASLVEPVRGRVLLHLYNSAF